MPTYKLGSLAPSLGAALGTGIAQPLNQALDILAQKKVEELKRRDLETLLTPRLGPSNAKFVSGLAPDLQKAAAQTQGSQPGKEGGQQITPEQAEEMANALISPAERRQREALDIKRAKEAREVSKDVRDFSKPFIEKAEAAEKNIKDYKAIIQLAETKGDEGLRAGPMYQFLSAVGLEGFNQNFSTALATKLMARLGQNATSAFGTGRLTNFLEQTFQRSLPTLWNTPEAIIAISKMNMLADQAEVIKNNVRAQIIKENKGVIPPDIYDQIRERARPELDKLEEESINVLNRATDQTSENAVPSFEELGEGDMAKDEEGNFYKRVRGQIYVKRKDGGWKQYAQ
jgi:hypothetical protein